MISNSKDYIKYRFIEEMSNQQESSGPFSVNKSPLNKSCSKAQFSFPKADRLVLTRPHLNDHIYDLPKVLNNRATSMGFGKKVDFSPKMNTPSPDRYHTISDFSRSPLKGKSIGIGRDNFKAIFIFPKSFSPGPGQYNNLPQSSSKNYSIRGRDGFPDIWNHSQVPGPGKYEIKNTTDKQFFFNSRQKSPQIYSIKPEHQSKGKENQLLSKIGPGKYQTNLPSMGKQILGGKKTGNSCIFMKEIRDARKAKLQTPGPGSYNHFSEFGK